MHEISFKDISIIKSGGVLESSKNGFSSSSKALNTGAGGVSTNSRLNPTKKSTKNMTKNMQEAAKAPWCPSGTQMSVKNTSWKKAIAETNMKPLEPTERATLFSTWTPLSDEKSNSKLFEERKQLCLKWFETWNDSQRRVAMEELLYSCKPRQLFHTRDILNKISPVYHIDFTRILPRVVCLYIMSFLDPRSLSRCSQVCWYWKMLSESDQLWMPKCLRFGWNLNYIPSSFESGIWKQFYIENIKSLQYMPLTKVNTPMVTERSELTLKDISNGRFGFSRFAKTSHKVPKNFKSASNLKQPPWKANNSNPNHLYRFNYLDTSEEIQNKKNEVVKKMKSLALDNYNTTLSNNPIPQTNTTSATAVDPQIIENLIAKGETLINQINAVKSGQNYTFAEKFERSFQLPNFANDDESLNITEDLFAVHRQANLSTQDDKKSSLFDKKQAWTLLES